MYFECTFLDAKNEKDTITGMDKQIKLLEDIKKLMILQLSLQEISNAEIGEALGVSYKTIERIVPKKAKRPKKR